MTLEIRPALPTDQGPIAELMYSAGPELYDFLYREKALDYIRYEFAKGTGFCGWHNVTVAVQEGKVVGTGCFYDRKTYNEMIGSSVKNFFSYFGVFETLPLLWRSRHTANSMRPPKPGEVYLANFGVDSSCRSQGVGSRMIQHKIQEAQSQGYNLFGLDVAVTNPRAQALYSKLGLQVKKEKVFTGNDPRVPACRKMELKLA